MRNLTDKELYKLCQTYGENALHWRRKFTGLLPEVNRRRLYERKGFTSIFEFAKKLCGLSEKQVRLALNLEERFEDKPVLKELLVNGEVSINKLTRVISVATPENEAFWAEKVQQLPKSALETFVKDVKNENKNGLFKTQNDEKVLPGQKLRLDADVEEKLLNLQAKGIDVNDVLREFLEERELEIACEKERLSAEAGQATSRHIPVKIRRHLEREYGSKCSIEGCGRSATVIHHTQRFALSVSHNPKYLAPLCREHHSIAHTIDTRVQVKRSSRWEM